MEKSMKVDENLDHLTEYERYLWLMKGYPDRAGKEYDSFRDGDYHYGTIERIWGFAILSLIVMLVIFPAFPYVGAFGGIITLVVWFVLLTRDYRVDHSKRRKFFEDNNVPNFKEYDNIPLPEEPNLDRLYFIVHKFKSEYGYTAWKRHVHKYIDYPVKVEGVEYFANIKEGDFVRE